MIKVSGHTPASKQLFSLAIKLEHRATITLGELLDVLGSAGVGLTILLLALPVMFPVPGPWGIILGSCLAIVSVQLFFGAGRLWLPVWVRKRNLPIEPLKVIVKRSAPWLQWMEMRMQPDRLNVLNGRLAQALMGIPMLLLAISLALPLPLGNFLPVIAFAIFALAFLERDGLAVVVALMVTVISLIWTGILIFLGAEIIDSVLGWLGMGSKLHI